MAAVSGRQGVPASRRGSAAKAAPVSPPPAKVAAKAAPASRAAAQTPARVGPAKPAPTKTAVVKAAPAKTVPAKPAAGKAPAKSGSANGTAKVVPAKAAPTAPTQTAPTKAAPVAAATAKAVAAAKPVVAGTPAVAAKSTTAKPADVKSGPAPAKVEAAPHWTPEELAAVRRGLLAELEDMQGEYDRSMDELNELHQTGTDGAGDDQADAGSKTFEREQELSIAANRLDLLNQIQRAIERVDAGTYGLCESCGNPIPKARLKAFPMATLDVVCKQREERR